MKGFRGPMTVSHLAVFEYTVINTVKDGGMSIDFIGLCWTKKTPKSLSGLGVLVFTGLLWI
jgi:hypothetical protein